MRKLDRMDIAVGVAIGVLLIAIIIVSSIGQQLRPRIVYLAPVDELVQNLYVAEVGQTNKDAKRLTNSQFGIHDYGVSTDGRYIAYSETQEDGSASLYFLDIATGKSVLLQDCADAVCSNPAFRPDGQAIAFERVELNTGTGMPPGVPRVWIFDLGSGKTQPLFSDNQQLGYMPRWSPDGKLLAVFNSNMRGISIYDFATGEAKTIPTEQGEVGQFSPDGRWMFFPKIIQLEDGRYVTHYVLVDLQSQFLVQTDLLADNDPSDDKDAIWTLDSKALIVARPVPGSQGLAAPQIHTIDITTAQAAPLFEDTNYSHGSLSLSPSGEMLLFQRFPLNKPGGRLEIWTYDFKTREIKRIAENATFARWLQ